MTKHVPARPTQLTWMQRGLLAPFGGVIRDWMLPLGVFAGEGAQTFSPSVNVRRTNGEFEVTAELPGMDREHIHVEVEANRVTISGERSSHRETEEDETFYLRESGYGFFERTVRLPEDVEEEKTRAEYKDGILTVHLPLRGRSRRNRVTIQ